MRGQARCGESRLIRAKTRGNKKRARGDGYRVAKVSRWVREVSGRDSWQEESHRGWLDGRSEWYRGAVPYAVAEVLRCPPPRREPCEAVRRAVAGQRRHHCYSAASFASRRADSSQCVSPFLEIFSFPPFMWLLRRGDAGDGRRAAGDWVPTFAAPRHSGMPCLRAGGGRGFGTAPNETGDGI